MLFRSYTRNVYLEAAKYNLTRILEKQGKIFKRRNKPRGGRRCPRCASGFMLTDIDTGEVFCDKCGFVSQYE